MAVAAGIDNEPQAEVEGTELGFAFPLEGAEDIPPVAVGRLELRFPTSWNDISVFCFGCCCSCCCQNLDGKVREVMLLTRDHGLKKRIYS